LSRTATDIIVGDDEATADDTLLNPVNTQVQACRLQQGRQDRMIMQLVMITQVLITERLIIDPLRD
jgi:hypothetical protein